MKARLSKSLDTIPRSSSRTLVVVVLNEPNNCLKKTLQITLPDPAQCTALY